MWVNGLVGAEFQNGHSSPTSQVMHRTMWCMYDLAQLTHKCAHNKTIRTWFSSLCLCFVVNVSVRADEEIDSGGQQGGKCAR